MTLYIHIKTRENNIVYIFTDGACKGNPGPGGWGAILKYIDSIKNYNMLSKYVICVACLCTIKLRYSKCITFRKRCEKGKFFHNQGEST